MLCTRAGFQEETGISSAAAAHSHPADNLQEGFTFINGIVTAPAGIT